MNDLYNSFYNHQISTIKMEPQMETNGWVLEPSLNALPFSPIDKNGNHPIVYFKFEDSSNPFPRHIEYPFKIHGLVGGEITYLESQKGIRCEWGWDKFVTVHFMVDD